MRALIRTNVLGLCLVTPYLVALPHQVSAQQAPPSDSYQHTIQDALSEYNAGNFAEARAQFEAAHALKPSARTWRGLGMTSFELKQYVRARTELASALSDDRQPLTSAQRSEVDAMLQRTDHYIGRLIVHGAPANAVSLLDGAPFSGAVTLDLGEHQLSVQAAGYRSLTRQVWVEGGKEQTVEVELTSLEISPSEAALSHPVESDSAAIVHNSRARASDSHSVLSQWWFWTAIGAVVAGGTVAAIVATRHAETKPVEPGDLGVIQALKFSR